jgi:hypothetical protein
MTNEATDYLFSYGTLQDEAVQRATFGRTLTGTPDVLVGFARTMLRITDPHVVATSGQAFHPIIRHTGNAADTVEGTVFQVTAAELAHADAYEVGDYRRVGTTLASGTRAWVYVSADPE